MTLEDKQRETKFPTPSYSKPTVTKQDRDEWFKRCIEDFPFARADWDLQTGCLRTKGYYQHALNSVVSKQLEDWFEAWFSQFDSSLTTKIKEEK